MELCQGTPVDVISDNEESCSSGSISSASDHVEHEGKLLLRVLMFTAFHRAHNGLKFVFFSDYLKHSRPNNCFTRFGEQVLFVPFFWDIRINMEAKCISS